MMEAKIGLLVFVLGVSSTGAYGGAYDTYGEPQLVGQPDNLQKAAHNFQFFGVRIVPQANQEPLNPPAPAYEPVQYTPDYVQQGPYPQQLTPQAPQSSPQVVPPSGPYNDAPMQFAVARLGAAVPVMQPALTRLAYNPTSAGIASAVPLVQPAVPRRVVFLPDVRAIPPPQPIIPPVYQPPLLQIPEYVPNVPTPIPSRPRNFYVPFTRTRSRPVTVLRLVPQSPPTPLPSFHYSPSPSTDGYFQIQYNVDDSSHLFKRQSRKRSPSLVEADRSVKKPNNSADLHWGLKSSSHHTKS